MSTRIQTMQFAKLLEIIRQDELNTTMSRDMAMQEIQRREKLFREAVEGALAEIEEDKRLHYPFASVDVNAPLALIQCALENQRRALKYVLMALDRKDGEE